MVPLNKIPKWLMAGALLGAGVLACLILFYFPPEKTPIYPRCMLYTLTGLQCPGCGGLRAAHHLLHGHIRTAFHYNPLLFVLLPVLGAIPLSYVYRTQTGHHLPH